MFSDDQGFWRKEFFGEVKNCNGVRDGVGGEEIFFISGERKGLWIAAAVLLSGSFGGKDIRDSCCRRVERDDLIAVSERNEEQGAVAIEQKRGGMRAAGERGFWFGERDFANDFPSQ
jgi:hypothetical protein